MKQVLENIEECVGTILYVSGVGVWVALAIRGIYEVFIK